MGQVAEIADYMKQNPSLKIGIDGSIPLGSNSKKLDLADLRTITVRDAMIEAGVPASRIETGEFGDSKLARNGRVEILLCTSSYYTKQ
jgi:outer membrane protein OmpA-like peptidoglycan-associated protein